MRGERRLPLFFCGGSGIELPLSFRCTITGIVNALKETGKLFVGPRRPSGRGLQQGCGAAVPQGDHRGGWHHQREKQSAQGGQGGGYVHGTPLLPLCLVNLIKQVIGSDANCIEIMPGYGAAARRWASATRWRRPQAGCQNTIPAMLLFTILAS